jgi:hypothetical protein
MADTITNNLINGMATYIKEPFEGRNSIKTSVRSLGMRKALVRLRMLAIPFDCLVINFLAEV